MLLLVINIWMHVAITILFSFILMRMENNSKIMYWNVGVTLGDRGKCPNQSVGLTRGCLACSRNVDGSNIAEGTLPSFLGCKGNGERDLFSELQDSVNVILQ